MLGLRKEANLVKYIYDPLVYFKMSPLGDLGAQQKGETDVRRYAQRNNTT